MAALEEQKVRVQLAAQDLARKKIGYDAAALIQLVSDGHVTIDRGGDVLWDDEADRVLPGVNAVPPLPAADASPQERARYLRLLRRDMKNVDLERPNAATVHAAKEARKVADAETRAEAEAILPPVTAADATSAQRLAYQLALMKLVEGEF